MKIWKVDRRSFKSATVWDANKDGELVAEHKCRPFSKLNRETRIWAIQRFLDGHNIKVELP